MNGHRQRNAKQIAGMIAIGCLCYASSSGGEVDIWGTGEVPRLTDPADVPQTLEEIWTSYEQNYDKNNPLEVKVHKTWEVDDGAIVVNWVQLTVGTFQGKRTIVCGHWAYPKGAKNLPAILNTHGGPQSGSEGGAVNFARLGYACFNPNQNENFKMSGNAAGLPNTDWGALDADSHRGNDGPFQASEKTIDAVASPRNYWQFPRQMSGRRIISFMQSQPQVNPEKIGIRGHSTGGSLTVYQSIDPRVTAAVPSVGGVGGFMDVHPVITGNTRHLRLQGERLKLFEETIEMRTYWGKMHAPILLLGASNDFNAPDWNCVEAVKRATVDKRYASCANYNHAFPPETMVSDYLWFQHKLKGEFSYPATPEAEMILDRQDGIPVFRVTPPKTDLKLKRVEMYYTDGRNPLTRFWMTGESKQNADGTWETQCPVTSTDEPLMAFANVIYAIDPIKAPNHRYNGQSEMASTSDYAWAWPDQLAAAGVKAQKIQHRLIDDFAAGLRDWAGSLANSYWWNITSRKVANPRFMGPKGAELVFEVNAPEPGTYIGVRAWRNYMNQHISEGQFYKFCELPNKGWNTVRIKTSDLKNRFGWELDDWHKLSVIELCSAATLKKDVETRYGGKIAERLIGDQPKEKFALQLGSVPDKVSGWNESYYSEAGDEYTKFNMVSKDDLLARQRFRNMRWEGGEYVERTKPYQIEKYIEPKVVGEAQSVKSPDGKLAFNLNTSASGLQYTVDWKGKRVVSSSALGPVVHGMDFNKSVVVEGMKPYSIDETYPMHGGKKVAENICNGARFELLSQGKVRWVLDVRCYDDGFGFRYILKDMPADMHADAAAFKFPEESIVWYTTRLEAPWDNQEVLGDMKPGTSMVFPITLELPQGGYAVINEAEILGFTSSRMQLHDDSSMSIQFNGKVPKRPGLKSAWRAVMLTETLDDMVDSTLFANLCPPPDPKLFPKGAQEEWIKPGRNLWQWWAYGTEGVEWETQKWFVDRAAELECPYYLVDEGWQDPRWGWVKDGKDEFAHLKELCDYAATKGVDILVWAAKPQSDQRFWPGTETREKADDFLAKVARTGAKGVKMDFIHTDDHESMVWYKNVLEVGAEHKLLVNFHGCTKPAGETRTYPNELSREDVFGMEQWKNRRLLSGRHFTALPFTRYAAGHGDITEAVLQRSHNVDTTLTLQLAQGIIYTSPLKCWADRPDVYLDSHATDIIRTTPPVWDETIVLPCSTIGETAAYARRSGNEWWIGIINGKKADDSRDIPLSFLGEGEWFATVFEDNYDSDYMDWKRSDGVRMTPKQTLKVKMKPSGGYIARLNRFAADAGGRFNGSRSVSIRGRAGNSYQYRLTPGMSGAKPYTGPVNVTESCRLDIECVKGPDQGESLSTWFVKAETANPPIMLPFDGNTVSKKIDIRLLGEFAKAKTYYTTDGSDPGAGASLYTGPFSVKNGTTVKAVSILNDKPSDITSRTYQVPVPAILPADGWLKQDQVTVSLKLDYAGAEIRYTIDGAEPTVGSTRYSQPFEVKSGTIVKAVTCANGLTSKVVSQVYAAPGAKGPLPELHLADLSIKKEIATVRPVQLNKSFSGTPLDVRGKRYTKGLGAHAHSELTYAIPADCKRFVATVGARGSVNLVVKIDGEVVALSPLVSNGRAWHLNVPLPPGAREICLIANDGGNGLGGDHVNWVDCGFVK